MIFALLLAVQFLDSDNEQEFIPTTFTVDYAYACKFENGKWSRTNVFHSTEKVYICVDITTNQPSIDHEFEVYVFEDEVNQRKEGIFFDYRSFTTGDKYIPINYEFSPGKYYVGAYDVRDTLFEIPIEVIKGIMKGWSGK